LSDPISDAPSVTWKYQYDGMHISKWKQHNLLFLLLLI